MVGCYNSSGSTISNFIDDPEADILNELEERIVDRIGEAQTIQNRPTILSGIGESPIIDDGSMGIWAKRLLNSIAGKLRNSDQNAAVFITIDDVHSGLNILINSFIYGVLFHVCVQLL